MNNEEPRCSRDAMALLPCGTPLVSTPQARRRGPAEGALPLPGTTANRSQLTTMNQSQVGAAPAEHDGRLSVWRVWREHARRSSPPISAHLGASRPISAHLGASRHISAHLGASRHIWAHFGASGRISAHLGASRRISAHLGASRRISAYLSTSRRHLGDISAQPSQAGSFASGALPPAGASRRTSSGFELAGWKGLPPSPPAAAVVRRTSSGSS